MLIEKEKQEFQTKLIAQLNENVALQGKVNRELEDKVRERTEEISHKNHLLEHQKEEVEAQRDEIESQRDMLKNQRDLVVSQKKEITDSISYAQRIQSAMLPQSSYLEKVMPEYFILYKPKDIVSGDFYWVKEIKNNLIVVGADCTGHGVPGGFMSMLGITLLNDLVGLDSLDRPGEILGKLRIKVKEMLTQEGKLDEQKDGMDMAIVILNQANKELQFAGANHPLYIVRKKNQLEKKDLESYASVESEGLQLYELKGDKQPIGVHWEEMEFTSHTIGMQKKDTFYIFSDGFADQYGGANRKKYKASNFKNLLLSVQKESLEKQKQLIENAFESWRKEVEQIDDVCVIGLRI
jgi:serine phosphatase RsbU (regulator of sigma subunit)